MDIKILEEEIKKLKEKGNLNRADKNKLKKLEDQKKKLQAQGSAEESIPEIKSEAPPAADNTLEQDEYDKATSEATAAYNLHQAEGQYTGISTDDSLPPAFQKFLDMFNPDLVDKGFESSEFITIRVHKEAKVYLDEIAKRLSAFLPENISGVQVWEMLFLEFKSRNRKKIQELNDLYVKKISDFKI